MSEKLGHNANGFVVSVCMATYNGGRYLREQMDSILHQDLSAYPDAELEIIVSDDGSTDDTLSILESYHDNRIKIYHHTKRREHRWKKASFACTENFGNAMQYATGDYIMLSDQDDVWYPNKMAKTIAELIAGHDMCMVGFDVVTPDLNYIGSVRYEYEPRWRLRRRKKLYGFSCGFTKKELQRYLPLPAIVAHDNFMMLVSSFEPIIQSLMKRLRCTDGVVSITSVRRSMTVHLSYETILE